MRETAIDAMPELAPQLLTDPTIVQRHLIRELGLQVTAHELELINDWPLDDSGISPLEAFDPTEEQINNAATLTKYERYAIIQSATIRQADILLGERPDNVADAQFVDGRFVRTGYTEDHYAYDHAALFDTAAEETRTAHPWIHKADERYMMLFQPFNNLRPYTHGEFPELPSMVLMEAMSGGGVRLHTTDTSEWLSKHKDTWQLPRAEKIKVAHDLAYLGLVFASQHFETVGRSSITKLNGDIVQLPKGQWIYTRGNSRSDPHYKFIRQRQERYAPTLKCPVHQPTKAEPTTDLEYYLHASIHATSNYKLFH